MKIIKIKLKMEINIRWNNNNNNNNSNNNNNNNHHNKNKLMNLKLNKIKKLIIYSKINNLKRQKRKKVRAKKEVLNQKIAIEIKAEAVVVAVTADITIRSMANIKKEVTLNLVLPHLVLLHLIEKGKEKLENCRKNVEK
jgi:hypothetical protein